MRREGLLQMFRHGHGCDGADPDRMCYSVMGHRVCKTAFVRITGIGNWSLQNARESFRSGHESSLSRCELGYAHGIQPNSKDNTYIDARSWLEYYADKFGDHSPMEMTTYLPKGRKSTVYAMYVHERGGKAVASLAVFLAAWRFELPWLIMAPALCNFVHCGVCDYLRDQIDRCPRSASAYLNALIDRLGSHFRFQAAQRLAMDQIAERCNQSEGKRWILTIDKMDQNAIWLPTKWSMMRTQLYRNGERIHVALIGTWWSGMASSAEIHLRTVFEDCKHGADMQCSTVMQNFHEKVLAEKTCA